MRDGCNFRSRIVGRSATIKADYRNYRCPISDVCLLLTLPLHRSPIKRRHGAPSLVCFVPGYKHVNGTTINHFRVLGPARQMDCLPPLATGSTGDFLVFLLLVSSSKLFVVAFCNIIPLSSLQFRRLMFVFDKREDRSSLT